VDDVSGDVVRSHAPHRFSSGHAKAQHVEVQDGFSLFRLADDKIRVLQHSGVDQHVNGTQALLGPLESVQNVFFDGHVGFEGAELAFFGHFFNSFYSSGQTHNLSQIHLYTCRANSSWVKILDDI
jgi:hypothetical protein